MKRSLDRILTTHVGSLARPPALVEMINVKESGEPYDMEAFAALAGEAVRDVIERQCESGIDVINDGEQAKASFHGYFLDRLEGFERKRTGGGMQYRRGPSRE